MQTLKWMELPHPSSLTSKARLTDWHGKQTCQSHLLLADSPAAAAAVPEFFLQHSAALVMQQKQVTVSEAGSLFQEPEKAHAARPERMLWPQ